MVTIRRHPWWFIVFALLSSLQGGESARRHSRRSDLADVPPVSASGWTVPLRGSTTCTPSGFCTDSLTPPANKPLSYLALARGVYTYTCDGRGVAEVPEVQAQSTQLYDAAPLIPGLVDEEAFHSLVPQLYQFDYMEIKNSTLDCMGTIGTINNTAIVTLFEVATFEARPYEFVLPPADLASNGVWAHSRSRAYSWDIYRVEVAGGAPPVCGNQATTMEIGYAAEYWFYHSEGEDLLTDVDDDDSQDTMEDPRTTKMI